MPKPTRIVTPHEPQPWSDLLEAALAKRAPLLTNETDAVRLVDGAGDGLPGIVLETYAGRWLLSTTGEVIPRELLDCLEDRGVSCYWKRLDRHQKESSTLLSGPAVMKPFLIREHGICYEISFQAGYSQGIFLDQRDNRAEVRRLMEPGLRLLNAFAYTGAFSVAAAMAGAETTTLDLSQPYLDWARRNFSHNRLDPDAHHFCKGDAFHWLRRFAKQKRVFDGIVLDPPTFSRDANGKIHLDPAQSLETWHSAVNPLPEIAGLRFLYRSCKTQQDQLDALFTPMWLASVYPEVRQPFTPPPPPSHTPAMGLLHFFLGGGAVLNF